MSKRYIWIIAFVSAFAGFGLSMIKWGSPDKVEATGWPVPQRISGLPEEEKTGALEILSDLGEYAVLLNAILCFLAGLALYSIAVLIQALIPKR